MAMGSLAMPDDSLGVVPSVVGEVQPVWSPLTSWGGSSPFSGRCLSLMAWGDMADDDHREMVLWGRI